MTKINSLGLFVGTSTCNAKCSHCAGLIHRQYAPKNDGQDNIELIQKTILSCWERGARSLSLSGSGEPTLSPQSITDILTYVNLLSQQNKKFSKIHLYSNGIRIGNDIQFCEKHLPLWQSLGLDTIYLTVHHTDEIKNAKIYGIQKYPKLNDIISRIHNANLKIRANIVLNTTHFKSNDDVQEVIENLLKLNVDAMSAWQIRNSDDVIDVEKCFSDNQLDSLEQWVCNNNFKQVKIYNEKNHQEQYVDGEKLTLFPDGTLSNTWCSNKS